MINAKRRRLDDETQREEKSSCGMLGRHFRGAYYLHHKVLMMEVVIISETSVNMYQTM
jgi:hypothetical protein